MVSFVQSYQLNNQSVNVDLSQIPEFSDVSKEIFHSLGETLPQALQTTAPLIDRISSLTQTEQMLQETLDEDTERKIFAFIKTALLVVFVAGTVAAFAFGGVGAIPAGVSLALFYFFMSGVLYSESVSMIEDIENRSPNEAKPEYLFQQPHKLENEQDAYPCGRFRYKVSHKHPQYAIRKTERTKDFKDVFISLLGGGLISPLFEAFTRKSRLERVLKEQKEGLQATLQTFKKENDSILPVAHRFFQEQSARLLSRIEEQIRSLETSLELLQTFSQKTEAGEKDLKERLLEYQKTKEELEAITAFYGRLGTSQS